MDVERWIRQAQAGDAAAFNHLVDTFQGVAYHVALHQLNGRREDAEDACQEAMLSAWRAVDRFEGDARGFRAWLVRIVVNACHDRRRYETRRPRESLEVVHDGEVYERPLPSPGQSPEAFALQGDLADVLAAALARLSPPHREVVLLDHAGFNYAEIAEILEVEVGTVKSRLSRARQHLREFLTTGSVGQEAAAAPHSGEPAPALAARTESAGSVTTEPALGPGRSPAAAPPDATAPPSTAPPTDAPET